MSDTEHGPNRPPFLQLNPTDPLIVATRELKAGEDLGLDVKPTETIARGHKMATKPIGGGAPVGRRARVTAAPTKPIAPGQHIHTHNVEFRPSTADHAIGSGRTNMPIFPEEKDATFVGIVRPAGTR